MQTGLFTFEGIVVMMQLRQSESQNYLLVLRITLKIINRSAFHAFSCPSCFFDVNLECIFQFMLLFLVPFAQRSLLRFWHLASFFYFIPNPFSNILANRNGIWIWTYMWSIYIKYWICCRVGKSYIVRNVRCWNISVFYLPKKNTNTIIFWSLQFRRKLESMSTTHPQDFSSCGITYGRKYYCELNYSKRKISIYCVASVNVCL